MHWACDNDLLDYFGSSDEDVTILKKFEQSTKSSLKSILLCVRGWHKLLLKFRLNETEINYILHDPNRVQELRAAETVAHIVDVIWQCEFDFTDPMTGQQVQTVVRLRK